MAKKQTFRFYTDQGKYMGWAYLNRENYHNGIKSWIRSGNYIMIDKLTINWINRGLVLLNSFYCSCISK